MVKVRPELALKTPKLRDILLLHSHPAFTDILLEERAREKKVVGLNLWSANVEPIANKFHKADMFYLARTTFLPLNIRDVVVPAKLSSWKEEDIAQ